MLTNYCFRNGRLENNDDPDQRCRALWIDLLSPTAEEEAEVEKNLGIDVPTQEEMQEIEISNRLYEDRGALFMTATLPSGMDTDRPESAPVTFILDEGHLITVRYNEPRAFQNFVTRPRFHGHSAVVSGEDILLGLLNAVINRTADIMEWIGVRTEEISRQLFQRPDQRVRKRRDFQFILGQIGHLGDLNSRIRECLMSLGRLFAFLGQALDERGENPYRGRLGTLNRDAAALNDHINFLSNKISFLLDATLGMINIEQNGIIKIFSVVAVVFLPPTLIASIYGMNFEHMPELGWRFGYPFALILMIVSALLPYGLFKRWGWL